MQIAQEDKGPHEAQSAFAQFRDTKFFPNLDGLRAISIILVIIGHTIQPISFPGMHLNFGKVGVSLFFAISGFLITTLLLRERERNGEIDLRKFYIRRSLRIFPLYYVVLGLYVVYVLTVAKNTPQAGTFWSNFPYFFTYTYNWFGDTGETAIFYIAWSLCTEEQFYAVWPVVLRFNPKNALKIAALVYLVSLILTLPYFIIQFEGVIWYSIAGSISSAIVGGVLLAFGLNHEPTYNKIAKFATDPFAYFMLGVIIACGAIPSHWGYWIAGLLGPLAVATCVAKVPRTISKALQIELFKLTGKVSYGLYLYHLLAKNISLPILNKLGIMNGYTLFFSTYAIALIISVLSFKLFEEKVLAYKERFAA